MDTIIMPELPIVSLPHDFLPSWMSTATAIDAYDYRYADMNTALSEAPRITQEERKQNQYPDDIPPDPIAELLDF